MYRSTHLGVQSHELFLVVKASYDETRGPHLGDSDKGNACKDASTDWSSELITDISRDGFHKHASLPGCNAQLHRKPDVQGRSSNCGMRHSWDTDGARRVLALSPRAAVWGCMCTKSIAACKHHYKDQGCCISDGISHWSTGC